MGNVVLVASHFVASRFVAPHHFVVGNIVDLSPVAFYYCRLLMWMLLKVLHLVVEQAI